MDWVSRYSRIPNTPPSRPIPILLSLASHRFEGLLAVLEPGLGRLTGYEVARALLGPDPELSSLDRWNAEGIVVSVHPVFCPSSDGFDVHPENGRQL